LRPANRWAGVKPVMEGGLGLRIQFKTVLPATPLKPSTAMRYDVPATAEKDTWLCTVLPPKMSSLATTDAKALTVAPV
jgi:hypothetical protein